MSRQTADTFCATLKGATRADPTTGELDSWKVGGKMFATFGERINGVCTKTDSVETAQMLIDANATTKAPYFHRSWVLVPLDAPRGELHHRLQTSYDIIRTNLPKKLRDTL
ncbi:MAG: putative DNA-binding protein (MmcQ/YjbR family) [Paracoccaceae bacterium]|jgi:predicted DNA-binding protein (MmcQ/YjbR family)